MKRMLCALLMLAPILLSGCALGPAAAKADDILGYVQEWKNKTQEWQGTVEEKIAAAQEKVQGQIDSSLAKWKAADLPEVSTWDEFTDALKDNPVKALTLGPGTLGTLIGYFFLSKKKASQDAAQQAAAVKTMAKVIEQHPESASIKAAMKTEAAKASPISAAVSAAKTSLGMS